MLRPCAHGADRYGIDTTQWRAHLCGLCLGLRDGQGQAARAATNTDALVLSVLTEAQSGAESRRTAGPCPLRGMRRAEVAAPDSPGIRLAATASLLLGAAKLRDHVEDRDGRALTRAPMTKVSDRWADGARAQAALIGLDLEPLVTAIAAQGALERGAGLSLEELTAPTQLCAAELFAHTAVLADRPDNVGPLREAGRHFGRIAHLADAVEDIEADRARGRYNPLDATGTDLPAAYALLRESSAALRRSVAAAELADVPTVRWMLLDPLHAVLARLRRGIGEPLAHACATHRDAPTASRRTGHRPPTQRPGLGAGLAIVLGVYCTGAACCVDHTSPCTGEQKDAWIKNCDCGSCCDCGDCCGNCCECDGCCCDGCGCDC